MASLDEVFENFTNDSNQSITNDPHSQLHSHSHSHNLNMHDQNMGDQNMGDQNMGDQNMGGQNMGGQNIEDEGNPSYNDSEPLINENDLNESENINDNIENDEIEIPDTEDLESFQNQDSNMINPELIESSQGISTYKLLLFILVPLILGAILYFVLYKMKNK